MTQPQIKNIFFVVISCFLFLIEIILFALLQQYDFYLLLCFFITLVIQMRQKRALAAPLFLMSMLSYLEMNIFGWCLVYIMPTMMFANYLDQHLRVKTIIPYTLLTFALCLKMIIAWFMYNINISALHATQIIVYNTIIITLFVVIGSHLEKKFGTTE
jgi:hypothetical protein